MWADLTGAPCLGNTFTDTGKYDSVEAPDYMTSGQPCPNYSRSGDHSGEDGEIGWMFVRQKLNRHVPIEEGCLKTAPAGGH